MITEANLGKTPTMAQRASVAATRANERFKFTDDKRMLAALAETALDEMVRSASFALRVRERYEELAPQKPLRGGKVSKRSTPVTKLVPIKEFPGFELDASRPLDPWFIIEYFGEGQLETALRMQPIGNLRKSVSVVEERYPGTAPKGKLSKEAAITYILQHVRR